MRVGSVFAVSLALLGLAACGKPEAGSNVPTDDPNWRIGYRAGLENSGHDKIAYLKGLRDGTDQGRDEVCSEIKKYSAKMAKDLDENTEICGYSGEDGSEASR